MGDAFIGINSKDINQARKARVESILGGELESTVTSEGKIGCLEKLFLPRRSRSIPSGLVVKHDTDKEEITVDLPELIVKRAVLSSKSFRVKGFYFERHETIYLMVIGENGDITSIRTRNGSRMENVWLNESDQYFRYLLLSGANALHRILNPRHQ